MTLYVLVFIMRIYENNIVWNKDFISQGNIQTKTACVSYGYQQRQAI